MKLAIKGHATRGKEVIEILEMLGWEVDIISFNPAVESKSNVCGRLKTEEEAVRAGIEYVEEQFVV